MESAATRRNFRIEERHRFQQLNSTGPSNTVRVKCVLSIMDLQWYKLLYLSNYTIFFEFQENRAMPSKFRATALANTTTNVEENLPSHFEKLHKINEHKSTKPVIADPNYNPTFVRSTKPLNEKTNNCQPVQLEEARGIQPSEPGTDFVSSFSDLNIKPQKT